MHYLDMVIWPDEEPSLSLGVPERDEAPVMAKTNIVKADTSTLVGWKLAHATHKSGPFFEAKIGEHEWWRCSGCGAKWPTTRNGI